MAEIRELPMALGLPSIGSPGTAVDQIAEDGVNGPDKRIASSR
jgi:hypothetical protein